MATKSRFFEVFSLALALGMILGITSAQTVQAGAPYPPDLVSPGDNETVSSNPPTLCAHATDPDGDPVSIRFESWGGGESSHNSPWIAVDGSGNACWTDSVAWSEGNHTWQARSLANGEEAASSTRGVIIPPPVVPPPATCTINSLTSSPPPAQPVGTSVTFTASATCTNGVASLRFLVEGSVIGTVAGGSGSVVWNTTGLAAIDYTYKVEAADNVAGYIAASSDSYQLTTGAPPPPPDVDCTINNFSIYPTSPQPPGTQVQVNASASCNTGVRAIRIKIGGSIQNEFAGSPTSWTWNTSGLPSGDYQITVEAAGVGDDHWTQSALQTSTYHLEESLPASAPVVNSFSTGDVIKIGTDIFVIINDQRRLVPNPETKDALGISDSWINNKGYSTTELSTIPRGSDIPDVERDPAGFIAFKQTYFPNITPITPSTATPLSLLASTMIPLPQTSEEASATESEGEETNFTVSTNTNESDKNFQNTLDEVTEFFMTDPSIDALLSTVQSLDTLTAATQVGAKIITGPASIALGISETLYNGNQCFTLEGNDRVKPCTDAALAAGGVILTAGLLIAAPWSTPWVLMLITSSGLSVTKFVVDVATKK